MGPRPLPDGADAASTTVLTRVTTDHLDGLMHLFAQAWWTRDRTREQVAAMLDSTPATAGLVNPKGELVAFARAISDFQFKAVIVDVIVDAPLRSTGLGRRVVSALLHHPVLTDVDDFELYCDHDLIAYYEALGFAQPARTHFMRLTRS